MKREKNPNQRAFKIVNKKAPVILPKPSEEELATNIGSEENVSFAMSKSSSSNLFIWARIIPHTRTYFSGPKFAHFSSRKNDILRALLKGLN